MQHVVLDCSFMLYKNYFYIYFNEVNINLSKIIFLFVVFNAYRRIFKKHYLRLSFYVPKKDQRTICKKFYNSSDEDKYGANIIYLFI